MQRLKVLLLMHELSRTGAPKVALDAIEAMGPEAVEVRVVSRDGGPLEQRCVRLGPLLLPFAAAPAGRIRSRLEWRRRHRAWAALRDWRPDVVYINSVASLALAKRLEETWGFVDAPMLLHVHELDSYLLPLAEQMPEWLLRRPRRFVAVSGAVERCLRDGCGVDARRISQIPPFVLERDFAGREFSPPRDTGAKLTVGGAGKPGWRKGTTLWLQAAERLLCRRGDSAVRCAWLGVPASRGDPMRIKARAMGLEGRVELLPPTDDPLSVLQGFDVLAMTSWEDPSPLVVFEAMMLGKAVACFGNGGGPPEQIDDTGVVVERFSADALVDAVEALLDDPERRLRLGRAARARVLERYTDRTIVPKLLEALRDVAGGRT